MAHFGNFVATSWHLSAALWQHYGTLRQLYSNFVSTLWHITTTLWQHYGTFRQHSTTQEQCSFSCKPDCTVVLNLNVGGQFLLPTLHYREPCYSIEKNVLLTFFILNQKNVRNGVFFIFGKLKKH